MAVCAKETFAFDAPDGAQVVVRRGQVFPDGHPHIKGREQLFEAADVMAARTAGAPDSTGAAVETAIAAPGSRRSVTRKQRANEEGEV